MIASLIFTLFLGFIEHGKEKAFVATTPPGNLVKQFLGIQTKDSIECIQWKLSLHDYVYLLVCNYKILDQNGKLKESKKLEFSERLYLDSNTYSLRYKGRFLRIRQINEGILHMLNDDGNFLIGNGGWSYSMNSINSSPSNEISVKPKPTIIKDSLIFVGRTPCGSLPQNNPCYKLKWKIVFYGDPAKNLPGRCIVYATPYRKEGGKRGTWKIVPGDNGKIFYHLLDESGRPYLYLQKADDNILLFTDASGKILIGDQDFSYTLNRAT